MKGKEAFFNELSCFPLADSDEEVNKRIDSLVDTVKSFKENGYGTIRCSDKGNCSILVKKDYSVADFCNKNPRGKKEMLLLSLIHPPYFKDNSTEETEYVHHSYKVKVETDDGQLIEKDAYGLAAAYLHRSIAMNMCSCAYWEEQKEYELIEVSDGKYKNCKVLAFCSDKDFLSDEYFCWRVKTEPRTFLERKSKESSEKAWSFSSNHHGNNVLRDFAKNSLLPISYVDEVVTSIEYSYNSQKTFVKAIYPETNCIDIVLIWEDVKYGMRIKTTAKNKVELYQMADELENKFNPQN